MKTKIKDYNFLWKYFYLKNINFFYRISKYVADILKRFLNLYIGIFE